MTKYFIALFNFLFEAATKMSNFFKCERGQVVLQLFFAIFIKTSRNLARYLNSGFGKIDFQGNFFPHEYVRIPRLAEECFQYIKLCSSEGCSFSSLLPRSSWKMEEV